MGTWICLGESVTQRSWNMYLRPVKQHSLQNDKHELWSSKIRDAYCPHTHIHTHMLRHMISSIWIFLLTVVIFGRLLFHTNSLLLDEMEAGKDYSPCLPERWIEESVFPMSATRLYLELYSQLLLLTTIVCQQETHKSHNKPRIHDFFLRNISLYIIFF